MTQKNRADHADRSDLHAVADLLWRTSTEQAVGASRPRLNATLIVDTAIALADTQGLDVLSMQRIGAELGCTAMALYRHVPSKNHLLAAMTDRAVGRPPAASPPGDPWRAEIESWVDALWRRYLRHPWMLQTPTLSAPVGPNELAWFEALLAPLQRAGLDRAELIPLATFVSSAVRDLARVATELDPTSAAVYGEVLTRRLDPDLFPLLCSLAGEEGLDETEDGDVTPIVSHGLQRLLDGVEAQGARHTSRTAHPASSTRRKEANHG
ncbi:TetR/AcrR family transcriptional regulator [Streptomyces sp. NPDC048337]|uniref:TetR/AcrR family transcriptional regulator n=1 Tax=Streptomyces sp. NPDC048337 TaxID=3365535 RepID=UPI0037141A52